jgi:talin
MSPAKLLDFYDLQSGDTIEYKKKHRPLRIQTLDGTTKTVIVDESLPVLNLVTVVCEKFGKWTFHSNG